MGGDGRILARAVIGDVREHMAQPPQPPLREACDDPAVAPAADRQGAGKARDQRLGHAPSGIDHLAEGFGIIGLVAAERLIGPGPVSGFLERLEAQPAIRVQPPHASISGVEEGVFCAPLGHGLMVVIGPLHHSIVDGKVERGRYTLEFPVINHTIHARCIAIDPHLATHPGKQRVAPRQGFEPVLQRREGCFARAVDVGEAAFRAKHPVLVNRDAEKKTEAHSVCIAQPRQANGLPGGHVMPRKRVQLKAGSLDWLSGNHILIAECFGEIHAARRAFI